MAHREGRDGRPAGEALDHIPPEDFRFSDAGIGPHHLSAGEGDEGHQGRSILVARQHGPARRIHRPGGAAEVPAQVVLVVAGVGRSEGVDDQGDAVGGAEEDLSPMPDHDGILTAVTAHMPARRIDRPRGLLPDRRRGVRGQQADGIRVRLPRPVLAPLVDHHRVVGRRRDRPGAEGATVVGPAGAVEHRHPSIGGVNQVQCIQVAMAAAHGADIEQQVGRIPLPAGAHHPIARVPEQHRGGQRGHGRNGVGHQSGGEGHGGLPRQFVPDDRGSDLGQGIGRGIIEGRDDAVRGRDLDAPGRHTAQVGPKGRREVRLMAVEPRRLQDPGHLGDQPQVVGG